MKVQRRSRIPVEYEPLTEIIKLMNDIEGDSLANIVNAMKELDGATSRRN